MEQYYTVSGVAKRFGVNRKTVYNWIKYGYIQSHAIKRKHLIDRQCIVDIERFGHYIIGAKRRDWPRLIYNIKNDPEARDWLNNLLINNGQLTI